MTHLCLAGQFLQPFTLADLTHAYRQEVTTLSFRFVGYELYSVNQTFKDTVEAMVNIMAPNATYTASYRPGVEAPIYGPDGINGTGSALAPTPGTGMWQNQEVPVKTSLPLYLEVISRQAIHESTVVK